VRLTGAGDPPTSAAERRLALIVLVGAAVVLGVAPILVRLGEVGPAAAGFWRFVFALPLLLILTARPGGGGIGLPSKWMALAGLFFVLDLAFWHYGIVMTSVANATTLCNLTPVVVTAFAWIAWGQRPKRLFLAALALAMVGAFAMAAGADGNQGTNPLLGDALSLSVALWYAGYFLAVQAARRTAGAMQVTLWATALGTPLLLGVAVLLGEDLLPDGAGGWAALAGLGVMHVVGQGGVAWALGRLPAAVTAVTILIQPVVAALLGWVLFAEALTPVQALGGALVLGAVVLAQRSAQTKAGAEPVSPAPAGS
jgi:drug/metabolite transporter (DMT)-like permease